MLLPSYFCSPEGRDVPFFQSGKIRYFCSGPISVDPICPQPRRGRSQAAPWSARIRAPTRPATRATRRATGSAPTATSASASAAAAVSVATARSSGTSTAAGRSRPAPCRPARACWTTPGAPGSRAPRARCTAGRPTRAAPPRRAARPSTRTIAYYSIASSILLFSIS